MHAEQLNLKYEMVNKDNRATFWQIRTIFTRLKSTKISTKKVQMVHDINFKANSSFIALYTMNPSVTENDYDQDHVPPAL